MPDITDNCMDRSGFTPVSRIVPDAVQEIRYHFSYNFVGAPIDGYEAPLALMTIPAAEALRRASDRIVRQGYRFKIFDAYRPRRAVRHFERWLESDDERMKPYFYPEMDKKTLIEEEFIARYSGHCRGSTLDVTLIDMMSGREVDMGGPFDFFGLKSYSACTDGLTEAQLDGRKRLRETMLGCGFHAIITEWWHYTLDDEPYPNTYFDFPVRI